jgi:glutamate decarboxylase
MNDDEARFAARRRSSPTSTRTRSASPRSWGPPSPAILYPDTEWDFRLEQVHSINASGHKFGLVYPGGGWLIFRSRDSLPEDLVFYEDYLGKRDATFTLNFSTGSAMVLAQYFNFIRFGRSGYEFLMKMMKSNAARYAERVKQLGPFELVGEGEQLPLVAFKLSGDQAYDEFDVASQLAAERGWMVPAYHLPPNAQEVKLMRVLAKLTLTHSLAVKLVEDLEQACKTLEAKGGVQQSERKRVHTGTGY